MGASFKVYIDKQSALASVGNEAELKMCSDLGRNVREIPNTLAHSSASRSTRRAIHR